ncbi:MAG: insulinase family protein [Gammaproteobacteria bacterium]|nr:insulinase family protein [Gammaproteobacteria bacterium]
MEQGSRWRRVIRAGAAAALWAVAPALIAGPEIEAWRTENGARVLFVAAGDLPIVDIQVVFDAGSARDGAGKGLARLANRLLDDGTAALSADQIAERFDRVGARFSLDSGRDQASVSLRSLTDRDLMDPALETMAAVIAEPAFRQGAFKRERGRMEVAVKDRKQSPGGLAGEAFYQAVFGDHPYGSHPGGDLDTLGALTPEQVRAFHRRHYVGRNAVVAIVGDLSRDRAERVAERVVGRLPRGEAAPALPPVPPLETPRTVRIAHPSSQTHVQVGQPGMARGDPRYFALYVGNHALGGGGFISRLMEEVRQQRGLSYSVYSYFVPMARRGPFEMGLQTQNRQAEEARRVMVETLKTFVAEGPTEDELAASKKNIVGGFPLRLDSNRDIVGYLAMIGFYELPLDYLETFTDRVEAVGVADVRRAFAERIRPDRLATVIVGGAVGPGE